MAVQIVDFIGDISEIVLERNGKMIRPIEHLAIGRNIIHDCCREGMNCKDALADYLNNYYYRLGGFHMIGFTVNFYCPREEMEVLYQKLQEIPQTVENMEKIHRELDYISGIIRLMDTFEELKKESEEQDRENE